MPRISLNEVQRMRKNGELVLETEKETVIRKRQEKGITKVENKKTTELVKIQSVFDDVKEFSNKEKMTWEGLVEEVSYLKDSLNSLIDSVNEEKASDAVFELYSLIYYSIRLSDSLEIDGEKAWKEILSLNGKKKKTSFIKNLGILKELFKNGE